MEKRPMDHRPVHKQKKRRYSGKISVRRVLALLLCFGVLCAIGITRISRDETKAEATPKEEVTEPEKKGDVFDDAVIAGNSFAESLRTYQLPPNAEFLSRIGLSIESSSTQYVSGGDGDRTLLEALQEKKYGTVLLFFGGNELSWDDPRTFAAHYQKLVAAVKEAQTTANIYIIAILPVTAEADAKNEEGVNNERIRQFNEEIRIMAWREKVGFIPPPPELYGEGLALNSEFSEDGQHLTYQANKIWVKYIADQLEVSQ